MEKQAFSIAMLDGIIFHLGDNVETIKGAKYWGEIIAFDTDDSLPGCTVLATDPGFAGTKHVYPLKQLQHRTVSENPHANRITELLEANNRYQQEARDARADLRRALDQVEQLRASDAKWGQLHQKVIEERAEALRENDNLRKQLATSPAEQAVEALIAAKCDIFEWMECLPGADRTVSLSVIAKIDAVLGTKDGTHA
jgi:hypothetical protein